MGYGDGTEQQNFRELVLLSSSVTKPKQKQDKQNKNEANQRKTNQQTQKQTCTDYSPSGTVNNSSASEGTPHISCNHKVHYRVQKSPLLVPILGLFNLIQPPNSIFKIPLKY
jgi:hypothetical protein